MFLICKMLFCTVKSCLRSFSAGKRRLFCSLKNEIENLSCISDDPPRPFDCKGSGQICWNIFWTSGPCYMTLRKCLPPYCGDPGPLWAPLAPPLPPPASDGGKPPFRKGLVTATYGPQAEIVTHSFVIS